VDLKERRRLEAARQHVAKARAHTRPWRSIVAFALAVIAAAVSRSTRAAASSPVSHQSAFRALGHTGAELVSDVAATAFCLFAALATAGLAGKAREVLAPKIGTAHAAVIRYSIVLAGGLAVIIVTLQLFDIAVTQLLVGGAFATVLIGIAAQQSLSNLFAGIVLLLARPVDVGDRVWIRSGALGGELRGTVTEIGITYVRLNTPDGPAHLPNSQVLAAAVAAVGNGKPDGATPAAPRQQRPAAQSNHVEDSQQDERHDGRYGQRA
jgi:small-conductance mechanosensitive channel